MDDSELAQANLTKVLMENPGLQYTEPLSAGWYEEKFPGLPEIAFNLLAAAGPAILPKQVDVTTSVTRRRRSTRGRTNRVRRENKFSLTLPGVAEMDDPIAEIFDD